MMFSGLPPDIFCQLLVLLLLEKMYLIFLDFLRQGLVGLDNSAGLLLGKNNSTVTTCSFYYPNAKKHSCGIRTSVRLDVG